MRADRFFAELYRRNPLLALVGSLHVVALVACAAAYLADDRQVMGINPWITPMKVMASIAVYLWTIAWFTRYIRRPRRLMKTVSIVIAVATTIESGCMLLLAARSTRTPFDVATDFDAALFQAMGIMIAINLLMVLVILLRFARPLRLPPAYAWGIRAGLVLFLVGGAIGGVMIGHGGEPVLPFVNWSTVAGDLEIAHGLALHALQLLPLAGWGLSRWRRLGGSGVRLTLLAATTVLYVALVYALLRGAQGNAWF